MHWTVILFGGTLLMRHSIARNYTVVILWRYYYYYYVDTMEILR